MDIFYFCKRDRCSRIVLPSPSPPQALTTSVLAQIVLSLETLPANLAAEGELRALMGPFVYHQVVRLGEPTLAVLADELAFWAQFASEIPCVVLVNLHHGEHFVWTKM